ncbi:major facilitator superfamily permease [Ferroplasma acidiphilum]|uniref:Major facilitator superfamily permease n=1 Tax=Ferroplasma acidiphilum TaxID=74969 RepID=A0A1V0N5J4_9ARCH|nr:major facilitator superfamily permease [Ferroplasma acidiphilum]MCL4349674.1 MFS transporter [Candidatus Thermoplasmatota archaeon]
MFIVFYLKSNVEFVGLVSAISSLASVPALIVWGNLSDKIKRRKIFIIIGFVGSFLSLLLVLVVHTVSTYMSMLILFQIVAMASVPVSTLLILENSDKSSWSNVMGKFNSYSAIGTVLGLGIGVLILTFFSGMGRELIPYLYIVAAWFYLIAGIISILVLKEPKTEISRGKIGYLYALHAIERVRYFPTHLVHIPGKENKIKIPDYLKLYLITTLILMMGFQLFFIPYPVFVIDRMNASENDIYIMYLLNSLFSAATFIPAGRYINYIGSNRMLSISTSIRVVLFLVMGVVSFFVFDTVGYLLLFIVMYGVFGAIWSFIGISEITSISNMATTLIRGKVIGYYNSLNGVGQIIGAGLSGFIAYDIGYSFDFILSAIIVLSGLLIIFYSKPPDIQYSKKIIKSHS